MEENGCEHEGLRFDRDLMALAPGRIGIILVAMIDGEGGGVCAEVKKEECYWNCESVVDQTAGIQLRRSAAK